jgi:hypothetical protein
VIHAVLVYPGRSWPGSLLPGSAVPSWSTQTVEAWHCTESCTRQWPQLAQGHYGTRHSEFVGRSMPVRYISTAIYVSLQLVGCWERPPAAFSPRSEAQRTAQSTIRLFARCGLTGRPFCASCMDVNVVSHLNIRDGDRGQNEFCRSLLENERSSHPTGESYRHDDSK